MENKSYIYIWQSEQNESGVHVVEWLPCDNLATGLTLSTEFHLSCKGLGIQLRAEEGPFSNNLTTRTVRDVSRTLPYLELPLDLVDPGLGLDLALEVDVVVLLDVGGVQGGAELERYPR